MEKKILTFIINNDNPTYIQLCTLIKIISIKKISTLKIINYIILHNIKLYDTNTLEYILNINNKKLNDHIILYEYDHIIKHNYSNWNCKRCHIFYKLSELNNLYKSLESQIIIRNILSNYFNTLYNKPININSICNEYYNILLVKYI